MVLDLVTNTVKVAQIILSGASTDGSLKIYSPDKFKIMLDGLNLASKRGPALDNQSKKRTFVHLSDGTVNTLSDASVYADDFYYPDDVAADGEDCKGCFFSEA